jgi:hypothetical protein
MFERIKLEHSTAQHSTAQHSTAQHSTAQAVFLACRCEDFFNIKITVRRITSLLD